MFIRRYVTSVSGYYHIVFTLYIYIVLEKNRSRSTIFKAILEQLIKIFCGTTIDMEVVNILPYTKKNSSKIG